MSFYERLIEETAPQREAFKAIPIIQQALKGKISCEAYLDFLTQAYHHVRHTCPLLALAAARTNDLVYRDALIHYLEEEHGHERWILDDISAMGGKTLTVAEEPRLACRVMVAYAHYSIDWISPYALLGMVHVLEGMSAALAGRVADAVASTLGTVDGRGVSYLRSHGTLDQGHVAFFRKLVNGIGKRDAETAIVDCTDVMYQLYGNIFCDIGRRYPEVAHAA